MKFDLYAKRRCLTTLEELYRVEANSLQEAINTIEDSDIDPESTEVLWEETRELSRKENDGESALKIYTYEDRQVYP